MPLGRYGITGDAARAYWYAVKDRVRANPEVEDAAIVTAPPLGGRVFQTGYNDMPGVEALSQRVDPEYFAVMRIPLMSGRLFAPGETALVVSRRLALEMYGTLDVLGRGFPKSAGRGRSTATDVAELGHLRAHRRRRGRRASIKVNATDVAELYRPLTPADFSLVYPGRARSEPARIGCRRSCARRRAWIRA